MGNYEFGNGKHGWGWELEVRVCGNWGMDRDLLKISTSNWISCLVYCWPNTVGGPFKDIFQCWQGEVVRAKGESWEGATLQELFREQVSFCKKILESR